MLEIDVCLVSSRRPLLLRQTLKSFEQNLFRNFSIRRMIVNIDPIFGTETDHRECVRLIREYDPEAIITEPSAPGFCLAVKRNWLASEADIILHIEDDWLLLKPVTQEDIACLQNHCDIGQVCFNHANKNWPVRQKGPACYGRRRLTLLGLPTPLRVRRPIFTTSPSFLRGSFARSCAKLMDTSFDPEKQFFKGVNLPLERFVAPYLNIVIGEKPDYFIFDIGRDWRSNQSIEKKFVNWQSVWTKN
jgi:hypothetical protein